MRQEEYKQNKKTNGINHYITQIPTWKKTDSPWLAEVDSMALQQSLRDLDKAYKNFFRSTGKVGFPRFKSKHNHRQSYRTNVISVLDTKHIKLPKVGVVKARISRPIEGRILSATVKQVPTGKYFVTICCADVPSPSISEGSIEILGIDAGIHDIATCSDGTRLANPKNLAKSEAKLRREQRKLSRKQKGSHNRERQRIKVARVHENIANQRKDTLHKFTTLAIRESQAIAVEDLHVKGMVRNHHLAKAIADASMSEMIRQLEYKCAWHGRNFVKVDRFYPSSKTCRVCGYHYKELTLAQRSWICPECKTHLDRDLNAAINIAREGERILNDTVGHTEIGAVA